MRNMYIVRSKMRGRHDFEFMHAQSKERLACGCWCRLTWIQPTQQHIHTHTICCAGETRLTHSRDKHKTAVEVLRWAATLNETSECMSERQQEGRRIEQTSATSTSAQTEVATNASSSFYFWKNGKKQKDLITKRARRRRGGRNLSSRSTLKFRNHHPWTSVHNTSGEISPFNTTTNCADYTSWLSPLFPLSEQPRGGTQPSHHADMLEGRDSTCVVRTGRD